MDNQNKLKLLNKLIEKSDTVKEKHHNNPEFKSWKNLVERTLISIYGNGSIQIGHFYNLKFFSSRISFDNRQGYEKKIADKNAFDASFKILMTAIHEYIEELKESINTSEENLEKQTTSDVSKVFISHSTKDSQFVTEIVDLLETIGLDSTQIFCTSVDGYGITIGDDFLNAIKSELSDNSLVFFILSDQFMNSPVCLCEMGATWVLSKEHIPILIPPFDYDDIKGVIPLTQGLKINESLKLNLLKEKVEQLFGIPSKLSQTTWERKRDRFITNIESLLL